MDPKSKNKIIDPQRIAEAFSSYYRALYNLKEYLDTSPPQGPDIETFLATLHLPTLTNAQLQALSTPITPQQIGKAIKSLPIGKSPGLDGLSNDYYKQFSETLAPSLSSVFAAAVTSASSPLLQAYILSQYQYQGRNLPPQLTISQSFY